MDTRIFDDDYNENYFLERIDNNIKLDEYELRDLVNFFSIDEIEGEDHRWQREVQTIIQLNNRYFSISWMRGLTELQENNYWKQPIEVELQEEEKVIKIQQWIPIVKENKDETLA